MSDLSSNFTKLLFGAACKCTKTAHLRTSKKIHTELYARYAVFCLFVRRSRTISRLFHS